MQQMFIDCYLMMADPVVITDDHHIVVAVNNAYQTVTGYSKETVVGKKAGIVKSGLTPYNTYMSMKRNLQLKLPWSGVFINRKADHSLWHCHSTITPVTFDGKVYFIGIFRDIGSIPEGTFITEHEAHTIQSQMFSVLALSSEIRDPGIEKHIMGVQALTEKLVYSYKEKYGLDDNYARNIVNVSILHDVGKSGIPEGILYKPGPLLKYERTIMEAHPIIGEDILNRIFGDKLKAFYAQEMEIARNIVLYHHEKWDGTGYPKRLQGEDIPLEARIVSIVDVYDALISDRSYKKAWSPLKALQYIESQKSIHFDPVVTEVFLELDIVKKRAG